MKLVGMKLASNPTDMITYGRLQARRVLFRSELVMSPLCRI